MELWDTLRELMIDLRTAEMVVGLIGFGAAGIILAVYFVWWIFHNWRGRG